MKKTFLIRMPSNLKAVLEDEAKRKGLTLTSLILIILNAYADSLKKVGD